MSKEDAWLLSSWVSFLFSWHLSYQEEAREYTFCTNTHLHAWMGTHATVDAQNTFRNAHPLLGMRRQSNVHQQKEIPEVLTTTQVHSAFIRCSPPLEVFSFCSFSTMNFDLICFNSKNTVPCQSETITLLRQGREATKTPMPPYKKIQASVAPIYICLIN